MTEPRYGALPEEWEFWSTTLGLMTELLPTICSPHATISPTSVLTNYHKVPCRYTTTGLVVGMPKWNALHSRAADIRDWSAEPDYGICLQMRTIQAFDVDITDADIVARITETLGLYAMPRRWRENSSKCLFLFHPATPSKKRVLKVGDGMIEMLGLGNQCLVAGQHPSGVRYQWDPFTRIPVLDDETVAWLMEDLRTDFGGKGTWSRGARVPTNVADPGGETRRKLERMAAKAAAKAGLVMTDGSAIRVTGDPSETLTGTGVFTPLVMDATTIVTDGTTLVTDDDVVDPVIDYLMEHGVVKGEGSDGLLYVTCPFEVAHGKQGDDTQTVYFPAGTGGYVLGHIKCLDGVCGDKTDRDFLDAWGWTLADGLRGFEAIPDDPQALVAVPAMLDAKDFMGIARTFTTRYFTKDERALLIRSNGSWYEHIGPKYREREWDSLRAIVWQFLSQARKLDGKRTSVPFQPTMQQVNSVLDALKAATHVEGISSPCWLPGAERGWAGDIVSLTNGLLHIPSRILMHHSPQFFTVNTLPYPWEPDRTAPNWQKFLNQLWPDDLESQSTLQEIFGYLLTGDTSQQKMFLIVGPKRSGKGTIGRVLKEVIGHENYVGPTLTSLTGGFGLQPLIGKLVAVIPDARIGSQTNVQAVVERLLMVSGEDTVTVDRKNRDSWTGTLSIRFVFLSNEVPQLGDASGALHGRFITLGLQKSFYGQEDVGLTQRLLEERPAILTWALAGRDRLRNRGYFIQPKSGVEIAEELGELSSPIEAFIKEQCDLGPTLEVEISDLFEAWRGWCSDNGRSHPGTKQTFGKMLHAALPQTRATRPRRAGEPVRHYAGICIIKNAPSPRLKGFEKVD